MERQLVKRAMAGDHEAFSVLAGASIARLYAVATLILRDPDRAQDAVQDALVSAWRDMRALRDPDAWGAWLQRLTVRACYRRARKERRRDLVELHVVPDPGRVGAGDVAWMVAERDRLQRHLDRLSTDQRAVMVVHFYLDLPLTETAVTSLSDAFVFGPDGGLLATWSVPVASDGSFAFPFGVQLDDQESIYIADAGGNRIDKFALSSPLEPSAPASPGVSAGTAASAGTAVAAVDWAVSRGDAGRDGHGTDGPAGNPVLRWRYQTQGSVDSPILIVGDLVYATSDDGILHAIDLATGDERWTYAPEDTRVSGPSVMDGVVYVFDADGTLLGLDALTGEERLRASGPLDGPGTPTVADGTVYVGASDGDLVALDGTTGEVRWRTSVTLAGPAHSPATADGRVYVGGSGRFIAVDAQSGDILWTFDTGDTETATAVVADGIAYVGTSADVEEGHLWALDAVTGEVRWTVDEAWFSPSVADGRAFSGSDAIGVAAHDTATGVELWRFAITGTTRPLAVADGVVYVPADDEHRVYALDAGTGAEHWHYEVDGGNDCCVAVSHGAVFVGTTFGGVYAISGDGTAR